MLKKKKKALKNSVGISLGSSALLFFIESIVRWISDNEIGWLIFYDSWGEEEFLSIPFQ